MKRINIGVFANDPDLDVTDIDKLIEAKETRKYIVDISIDGADDAKIVLYAPASPNQYKNRRLIPLQNADDTIINFTDIQILDQLKSSVKRIHDRAIQPEPSQQHTDKENLAPAK